MKKSIKRALAAVMVLALTATLAGTSSEVEAAQKIKLAQKSITVTKGETKKVAIKNVKAKKVKKLTVKSSKKKVAVAVASGKTALKVTGKKNGSAKVAVTIKLKGSKKITKLTLKVNVKNANATTTSTVKTTPTSSVTADSDMASVTSTATQTPSPAVTTSSTEIAAVTQTPSPAVTTSSTETAAVTQTLSPAVTTSSTETAAVTQTPSPAATASSTETAAVTQTPSPATTASSTETAAVTQTLSPAATASSTETAAVTQTPSPAATASSTVTATDTASSDSTKVHITGELTQFDSPLVNATIDIAPSAGGSAESGTTDKDGYFDISLSKDTIGSYDLIYRNGESVLLLDTFDVNKKDINLGTIAADIVYVTGYVKDTTGSVCADITLGIEKDYGFYVTTDNTGKYGIYLRAGLSYSVCLYLSNCKTLLETFTPVSNSAEQTKNFTIPKILHITGTLTRFGELLTDANIYVVPNEGGIAQRGTTDENGCFDISLTEDSEGSYGLFYSYGNHGLRLATFEVGGSDIDLGTVESNLVHITGTVKDGEGNVYANTKIGFYGSISGFTTETDANGTYDDYVLATDVYYVCLCDSTETLLETFTPAAKNPEQTEDLTIVHVTGKLTQFGEPLANASIDIAPAAGGSASIMTTADDGSFDIPLLAGDKLSYTLHYCIESYGSISISTFTVSDRNIDLGTVPADIVHVTGTVQDNNGNACANQELTFFNDSTAFSVKTDANGQYSIYFVSGDETYSVYLHESGSSTLLGTFTMASDSVEQTKDFTIKEK